MSELDERAIRATRRALNNLGWDLSDEGVLQTRGSIDLSTGGRPALDEQLARLRRGTEDPALLLGTSKDLLEAVAKFVLEGLSFPPRANANFGELLYLSRERLSLLPQQVIADAGDGARAIQTVLQAAWTIAEQVNKLRGTDGTGHGHTLPTGVTPELALLVVREACSVAELMLNALDRTRGHVPAN